MKGHMGLKALAIALIAIMILPPVANLLAQAATTTTTSNATPVDTAQLAAQMYIKRIGIFINKTLQAAEKNNITIPENLTGLVNESRSLLAEAQQELEAGNITGAVNLATQAADTFAPVAVYVWSHIPSSEKQELAQYSLIRAINARIQALEKLNIYVERLNESGVDVRPLIEILEKVNATLQEALDKAEAGNLTAARILMKKADYMLMVEFKLALHGINGRIHQVAACAAAFQGLARTLQATNSNLNKTITLIEENRTREAITQLQDVEARLTKLSIILERIYQEAVETNSSPTITQVLRILVNATAEARAYINASIQALERGDVNTSMADVTLAIETLNGVITSINQSGLPRILHKHLLVLHVEAEKARRAIAHEHAKVYSAIAFKVDKIRSHLEYMLALYQNGTISKQELVRAFTHAYIMLEKMKNALGNHAPKWLIEKINETLQWIKQTVPEVGNTPGSNPGSPGGGGGHGGQGPGNGSGGGGTPGQGGGSGSGPGNYGGHGTKP